MNIQEFISSLPWQTIAFCFAGFAAIMISLFASSNSKQLKKSGITVNGIIFSLGKDSRLTTSDSYSTNVKDKIIVRFLTKEDVWITEQFKANFLIAYTGQYKEGEAVKVTYDPKNPANFTLAHKQSEIIGRLLFAIAGLAFLIIGVFKYFDK